MRGAGSKGNGPEVTDGQMAPKGQSAGASVCRGGLFASGSSMNGSKSAVVESARCLWQVRRGGSRGQVKQVKQVKKRTGWGFGRGTSVCRGGIVEMKPREGEEDVSRRDDGRVGG